MDGTLWTTTWTTADASPFSGGTISFMDAASTADGGFVVIGRFDTATLDAGGHLLQASDPSAGPYGVNDTSFVAALDRNGATRWAAVFGKSDAARQFIARRIVPSGDGVMICGNYSGASQPGLPATDGTIDAFVERIDASGAIIAHPISGTGEQICEALAGAADGSATMTLTSFDAPGGGLLRAGSQTFETGPQTEVFVVNLAL